MLFYLLFKKETLLNEREIDAHAVSDHDFGKNVIPQMLKNGRRIFVHNFVDKNNKPHYWRDIGTRDAYYQANMDMLGRKSIFNLYEKSWPVRTFHEQYPPIKMVSSENGPGSIIDSMIAGGCIIEGGTVESSILSSNVKIHNGAEVKRSVLMEGVTVGENAKIQNAIIDKEVIIPPNSKIGYDVEQDKKRFVLTTSGIVNVPKRIEII